MIGHTAPDYRDTGTDHLIKGMQPSRGCKHLRCDKSEEKSQRLWYFRFCNSIFLRLLRRDIRRLSLECERCNWCRLPSRERRRGLGPRKLNHSLSGEDLLSDRITKVRIRFPWQIKRQNNLKNVKSYSPWKSPQRYPSDTLRYSLHWAWHYVEQM